MRNPYQCMTRCKAVLVAARGSSIDLFKLEDGTLLSTWTSSYSLHPNQTTLGEISVSSEVVTTDASSIGTLGGKSPPAKRRKISNNDVPQISVEVKDGGKKKQNARAIATARDLESPTVIILTSTTDGEHVIAVTAEDKSIRVLKVFVHDGVHQLKQLSRRPMPKRPCSLAIGDDSTIVSADKFGDVYALPLIPSDKPKKPEAGSTQSSKPYVPAASELTIHSQRNRKALENQKRHSNTALEKAEIRFEHELLLGHVSMLIDLVLVAAGGHKYVLTSDRDEHIRISRGIPQAHIIEGFCLGHTEFVSRLCVPEQRPELLISGGGDDELFVWDWRACQMISKVDLKKHVQVLSMPGQESKSGIPESVKIAVSGLHHVRGHLGSQVRDYVIVTCECVPALFLLTLDHTENTLIHVQTIELPGNPLALLTDIPRGQDDDSGTGIIVSIDFKHKPGSPAQLRPSTSEATPAIISLHFSQERLQRYAFNYEERKDSLINGQDENGQDENGQDDHAGGGNDMLYSLENMRKREGDEQVNDTQ